MKLLRWAAAWACAVLGSAAPAVAADYNAEVAFQFFSGTCVRRLAIPDSIRAWASATRLPAIVDPDALNTFVGATRGAKGAAWMLPSPNDLKFTLSIRAGTQTCAVWAEAGDPATAEDLFRKLMSGAANSSSNEISTDEDQSFPTAGGKSRLLTMSVINKTNGEGYKFTFMAGDQSGSFFSGAPVQLSLQMTRVDAPKK